MSNKSDSKSELDHLCDILGLGDKLKECEMKGVKKTDFLIVRVKAGLYNKVTPGEFESLSHMLRREFGGKLKIIIVPDTFDFEMVDDRELIEKYGLKRTDRSVEFVDSNLNYNRRLDRDE